MPFLKKPSGFTLIELLISIAIIAILSTVVLVAVTGKNQARARDSLRKNDLGQLAAPLQAYYVDHGVYPPEAPYSETEFTSLDGDDWIQGLVPDYVKVLPKDPRQTASNPWQRLAGTFKLPSLNVFADPDDCSILTNYNPLTQTGDELVNGVTVTGNPNWIMKGTKSNPSYMLALWWLGTMNGDDFHATPSTIYSVGAGSDKFYDGPAQVACAIQDSSGADIYFSKTYLIIAENGNPAAPPPSGPNAYFYSYVVPVNRQTFTLWTTLEDTKDKQIYYRQGAKCKKFPPPGTTYNYCITSN